MRVLDAKRAATCWNLAGGMDPGSKGNLTLAAYQTCGGEVLGYLPGAQSSEFARTGAWPVYFAAVSIGGCTRRVSSVTA